MTMRNRISGVVRLTTPLHTASPDKSLALGEHKDNQTPTMQHRFFIGTRQEKVPYFSGNDLRGRLRRKAAKLVCDHITVAGKIRQELYAGLVNGTIAAPDRDSTPTVGEVLRARDNVYMGLFGGGARVLKSRYRVADLWPIIAALVELGTVPKAFGEAEGSHLVPMVYHASGEEPKPASGSDLIEIVTAFKLDDVYDVARPAEILQYVENGLESVAAYQGGMAEMDAKRKEDKAKAKAGEIGKSEIAGKKSLKNMLTYQAIKAGTPLYFDLDFADDASDAHIGLMLMSLELLVREQALGGWIRAGLGKYTADLTLTREGVQYPVFAQVQAAADATLSDVVKPFIAAASEALKAISAEEMMMFFLNRKDQTDPEKTTKKAKKIATTATPVETA